MLNNDLTLLGKRPSGCTTSRWEGIRSSVPYAKGSANTVPYVENSANSLRSVSYHIHGVARTFLKQFKTVEIQIKPFRLYQVEVQIAFDPFACGSSIHAYNDAE